MNKKNKVGDTCYCGMYLPWINDRIENIEHKIVGETHLYYIVNTPTVNNITRKIPKNLVRKYFTKEPV